MAVRGKSRWISGRAGAEEAGRQNEAWHIPRGQGAVVRRTDEVPGAVAIDSNGDGFEEVIDLDGLASRPAVGFIIQGDFNGDLAGSSVSSAGDVNGDGFDDLIVGAPDSPAGFAGEAYVIFGKAGGFGTIDLTGLASRPADGFIIQNYGAYDLLGTSVSSAGDINGDGFDDIVVGEPRGTDDNYSPTGKAYVIFGKATGFGTIDVAQLAATGGFVIQGDGVFDNVGLSVSGAGDVNGDGFDDIIIGAPGGDNGGDSAGEAYVIFGKAAGFGLIDLATLAPADGFVIQGDASFDGAGTSVSSAGDINGDGFDDLIIGAPQNTGTGKAYVIFGKASGLGPIDLATLAPGQGFAIMGDASSDRAGHSVSSAGDINGDGFDDLVVGAPDGDDGAAGAGQAYVIFGKAGEFGTIDLATFDPSSSGHDPSAGFVIRGGNVSGKVGFSVSEAGDVNGDGFDDLIVGARYGEGVTHTGRSYVIFGKIGGFGPIDLNTLTAAQGFAIHGDAERDYAGHSVSGAGDVNGDGFADLIIGAPGGDDGGSFAGEAYVIFGQAPTVAVTRIGSAIGQTIYGGAFNDVLDGAAGDDVLFGVGGNDTLLGGAGIDTIYGGEGDDVIDGGAGQDFIHGDDGNDTLTATGGTGDWLMGGLGDDTLTASGGSFNMFGDEGGSTEEDGDDHLVLTQGGSGSWLSGGGGNDVIHASGSGLVIADGGTGDDHITIQGFTNGSASLGPGNDTLRLPTGFFNVFLDTGRDEIIISSAGSGFITIFGFAAGEAGDRLDLSIYGADPFGTGTLIMSRNGPDTVIDHGASGMRYVLQSVLGANLSAYNLGVPNPNYAPQGMTLDDAFASYPDIEHAGELIGADGDDVIRGHAGNDRLYGSGGNDLLQGGSGDDLLDGGTGVDRLEGGLGNDWYFIDGNDAVIEGVSEGTSDWVFASVSYTLAPGSHIEILSTDFHAGTAAISLSGNELGNVIFGNAGNNVLDGKGGIDTLVGLGGDDWYFVDHANDYVVEGVSEGSGDRVFAGVSYTLAPGSHVEIFSTDFHAGTAAIDLSGNELGNLIFGNAGNNVLDGKGGIDTLVGFGGDDWYYVDHAVDYVVEGASEGTGDRIFASVSYTLAPGSYVENLSTDFHAGTAAIDLSGNELGNLIFGNAGNNVLDGRGGIDTLVGFGGDDWYYVDHAGDYIVEGASEGTDDRVFASVSYTLAPGSHIEILSTDFHAGTAAINLSGNELGNVIFGNAGNNVLDGRGGIDTLVGLGGDDWYFVDHASDYVVEGASEGAGDRVFAGTSYTLAAGAHIEILSTDFHAGTAAIDLRGNEFGNVLYGNAGANVLDGKGGNDVLFGFGGADTFAFTTAPGAGNVDTILDFDADDTIALDDAVFAGLGLGALSANAFTAGTQATTAGHRIVYDQATGNLFFDADGNGGGAAVLFASLNGNPTLTASDFTVI